MVTTFRCKMCGAPLQINGEQTTATCEYCGAVQTLPKLSDERRAQMYDRANHFRRNNEFDKASGIYEQILNEDHTDAEAYWSLVLCKYGIEYVEDPSTHQRIPTVNRTQMTSIFDDENYKSALQYADGSQRSIYEAEASAINEIQKGILAISQQEEPFDVFICYKETDRDGQRTRDSVLAQDLYYELTQMGLKVFFSRITLENKLGTAYEPYIFAALNSAKVMVVLGTKPEYFNAVWVKNEWSRYLALIEGGAKKALIPAYRDMDPYDLPDEFSHLQALDMSRLGFMQDLIHGIRKLTEDDTEQTTVQETVVVSGETVELAPLLKRAALYLEDGDWENADTYCERVLDRDPENAEAYLLKLMAELQIHTKNDFCTVAKPFDASGNYQKVLRFGDTQLQAQVIHYAKMAEENQKKDQILLQAYQLVRRKAPQLEEQMADLTQAISKYELISGWRDADTQAANCRKRLNDLQLLQQRKAEEKKVAAERRKKIIKIATPIAAVAAVFAVILITVILPSKRYQDGIDLLHSGAYTDAVGIFTDLGNYKDSATYLDQAKSAVYQQAQSQIGEGDIVGAIVSLQTIPGYQDSMALRQSLCQQAKGAIAAGGDHTVGLKSNGTVTAVGSNTFGQCNVSRWRGIAAVAASDDYTLGLKSDGTVVLAGIMSHESDMESWSGIVAIAAGSNHAVGLKGDGTVVAAGYRWDDQCDVESWRDIVAIATGNYHTVGLKSDGTVVAVGENTNGQCDVSNWRDIVAIAAGNYHTVGLKSDGTVVAVGKNEDDRCDVSDWKDIVSVAAGSYHTVGLKSDGTVVAVGDNWNEQCEVSNWKDIVALSAGSSKTVGLKSDGTVIVAPSRTYSDYDVGDWTGIRPPQ